MRLLQLIFFSTGAALLAGRPPSIGFSAEKAKQETSTSKAVWQYKRTITVQHPGKQASNAVILLTFTGAQFDYGKAKPNGADIRFTTKSGSLSGDELAYWIEQWNVAGETRIWVKLPTLRARGTTAMVMYYGNTHAQSASNGNQTFLFFDDFDDGDYTRKWTNTSIGEVVEQDGYLALKETDGQDGIITANFTLTGPLIVRTGYQRGGGDAHWVRAGVGGWDKWLCFGDHTDTAASGTNYVMLFKGTSLGNLQSAPLVKVANQDITNAWRRVAFWYDGHRLNGIQDQVTVNWPMRNASSKLTLRTLDNDSWDRFAFVTVSAYTGPEPTVVLGQQQSNEFTSN